VQGYLNFHAYAQSWLTPYGYTDRAPKHEEGDAEDIMRLCVNVLNAMDSTHDKNLAQSSQTKHSYLCGSAYTKIYPANGILADWTYDALGVKYSQSVELRGRRNGEKNGFMAQPSQIIPNGKEIWRAVQVLARTILAEDKQRNAQAEGFMQRESGGEGGGSRSNSKSNSKSNSAASAAASLELSERSEVAVSAALLLVGNSKKQEEESSSISRSITTITAAAATLVAVALVSLLVMAMVAGRGRARRVSLCSHRHTASVPLPLPDGAGGAGAGVLQAL